jgi:hypothetical protein
VRSLVVLAVLGATAAGSPDPARLVLRTGDLPKGYSILRANTGPVTNAAAAQGNAEIKRSFTVWGRITGYNVEWDGGLAGAISSSAELFRTPGGAKSYLTWSVANAPTRTGLVFHRRAGLGEEAYVARKSFGGAPWVIVIWRYRSVVATTSADTLGVERTVALARIEQRRVAAGLR